MCVRSLALSLAALLIAAACSARAPADAEVQAITLDNDSTGAARVQIDATTLEIAAELKSDLAVFVHRRSVASVTDLRWGAVPPDAHESGVWIRGHPVTVTDGTLRIGDRSYGAVAGNAAAQVSGAVVQIGGEVRGELPARK